MNLPAVTIQFDVWDVVPQRALDLDERLRTVVHNVMADEVGRFSVDQVRRQIVRFGLDRKGGHSRLYNSISWDFKVTTNTATRMQIDGRVFAKPGPENTPAKVAAIEGGRRAGSPPPPVDEIEDWVSDVLSVKLRRKEREDRQQQLKRHQQTTVNARKAGKPIPARPPARPRATAELTEEQVAFVVARQIGIEGTPAKPIFGGAFIQIARGADRPIEDALGTL